MPVTTRVAVRLASPLVWMTPSRTLLMRCVTTSAVSLECRMTQCIRLQAADGTAVDSWLTLGEVVAVHISKALLRDGIYDTAAARPILRAGGPADYFEIGADTLFRMFDDTHTNVIKQNVIKIKKHF